jgi:hypothetical protein
MRMHQRADQGNAFTVRCVGSYVRRGHHNLRRAQGILADQIHMLPGIGPKTAQSIREELARLTPSKKACD